jgi:hypothetical protein
MTHIRHIKANRQLGQEHDRLVLSCLEETPDNQRARVLILDMGAPDLPRLLNWLDYWHCADPPAWIADNIPMAEYIEQRCLTGCGDQGHDDAVKAANKVLAGVRKAMGFTYPKRGCFTF